MTLAQNIATTTITIQCLKSQRLADLEAAVEAHKARIRELTSTNELLTAHGQQQRDLIAAYEQDFAQSSSSAADARPSLAQSSPSAADARSFLAHLRLPPREKRTPYHVEARTAPTLHLAFIVPGLKGEALDINADTMDLAFILSQTLKRKGWKEETTQKSVLDFMDVPLIKVEWTDKVGEIGKLAKP